MKTITLKLFGILIVLFIYTSGVFAQTSITAIGTSVTQDFDALTTSTTYQTWTDNSTLVGWYAKTDLQSPILYRANNGSNTKNLLYSLGTSLVAERAIGYVPSDTFTGASGVGNGYVGWRLKNNTTKTIGSIRIVWTGEQWRKAVDANIQYIRLSYQIASSVTNLTSGSYILTNSSFASPIHTTDAAIALDGNAAANRTSGITIDINVIIPAGDEIMLRWEDLNDPANHTLAIDDVSFTATKESQSITFSTFPDKTFGDAPIILNATASSGLAVSYTSSNTSVATISGNTLTIVGAGTTTIAASQTGSALFTPADTVFRVLNVKPQAPIAQIATAITPVSFTANWSAASGATGYYLYYGTDPTLTTYTAASVGLVTTFNVTGILPSTTYYYRLKSINTGIYSNYSNIIDVTTGPGIQVSNIIATNGPLTLTWTNGNLGNRAVFIKEGVGVITNPDNATRYYESTDWSIPGDELGLSGYYCVFYGVDNFVTLTNLTEGALYTVQAFEFIGTEWDEIYLTSVSGTNNPITFVAPYNKWKGTTSTVWGLSGNWTEKFVPATNANIIFDDAPLRDCNLDIDRSVTDITNAQSTYKVVTNGHKLTIKGDLNFTNGAQMDASAVGSTVDYNGTAQTVVAPTSTYYNLTLSNSGIKTLPASALTIANDFTTSGTATADAGANLAVGRHISIGAGSTFNTNGFYHSVAGNFTNAGTYSHVLGDMQFNGTSLQEITGVSSFYNLVMNNTSTGLKLNDNINISNKIAFTDGDINLNGKIITLAATALLENETNDNRIFGATGTVEITKTLYVGDLNSGLGVNIGNLGAVIKTSQALGVTTIRRGHTVQTSGTTGTSIERYFDFDVTNNSNLNATVRVKFFDKELNNLNKSNLYHYEKAHASSVWAGHFTPDLGLPAAEPGEGFVQNSSLSVLNDITTLSEVNGSGALPINLIEFVANCESNKTKVEWKTASENNSDFFTVEKSTDALNYKLIEKVKAARFSNTTLEYAVFDNEKSFGNVYYRLTEVDIDGTINTFDVITSSCNQNPISAISIGPNPFNADFNIQFNSGVETIAEIKLLSSDGTLVYTSNETVNTGNNKITINTENLISGLYNLTISINGEHFNKKVVKN